MKRLVTIWTLLGLFIIGVMFGHMRTQDRMISQMKLQLAHHEDGLKEIGSSVYNLQIKAGSQFESSMLKDAEPDAGNHIHGVRI